jgi:hypothetical protein
LKESGSDHALLQRSLEGQRLEKAHVG